MNKRSVAVLAALALTFGVVGVAVAAQDKVEICHATHADNNPEQPYNSANASKTADAGGHDGHDGPIWFEGAEDWGDIIPPFEIEGGGSYPGQNWDAQGQAILEGADGEAGTDDDCVWVPAPGDGGEDDLTQAPTDTLTDRGIGSPADSAWLLVVALGVLLASVVVLAPARVKSRR